MNQKFTSTIAGASIFISLMAITSRSVGFIREIIFAGYFGTGSEFDLYLVGAVLPVTINNILLYIGQNFFIPGIQKLIPINKDEAREYYSQWFIIFFTGGTLFALLLFLFSDQIVNLYVSSASLESKLIAVKIFKIFLITIPFASAVSILSALLQTIYEYKYPAISVLFLNICVIVAIVLFTDKIGIYVIPIGYCLGTFLQFCYLMFNTEKIFKLNLIFNIKKNNFISLNLTSSFVIIVLIEIISQLYTIFDRHFYSEVSAGGIASLNYAMMIWFMPISIFSISLATAIFPKITNAINQSSNFEIEKIFNDSISMNLLIFIPFTSILFFHGDTLIKLFFERGKFLQSSSLITFDVLRLYSISLVFYSIYTVFNKIFYSLNLIKLLLYITISGLVIKLVLNFLLINFQQNGLALSTSISFFYFSIISYTILNFKLRIKNRSLFIKEFISHIINCGLSILIIKILFDLLPESNLIYEMLSIVVFLVLYMLNLVLIRYESLLTIKELLNRFNPWSFKTS